MNLRKTAANRFHIVWPAFKDWQKNFDISKTLASLRSPIPDIIIEKPKPEYSIAFVVFSTEGGCGGMKVIADIVNELNERNVNAKVVHVKRNPKSPAEPLTELRSAPIVFNNVKALVEKK